MGPWSGESLITYFSQSPGWGEHRVLTFDRSLVRRSIKYLESAYRWEITLVMVYRLHVATQVVKPVKTHVTVDALVIFGA